MGMVYQQSGPDQVAKSGIWESFEAKGGNAILGKTVTLGRQMEGKWIRHWIEQIITKNGGQQRDDLKEAFNTGTNMLAVVVRVNIHNKNNQDPNIRSKIQAEKTVRTCIRGQRH
jgi:hypothetical protein